VTGVLSQAPFHLSRAPQVDGRAHTQPMSFSFRLIALHRPLGAKAGRAPGRGGKAGAVLAGEANSRRAKLGVRSGISPSPHNFLDAARKTRVILNFLSTAGLGASGNRTAP
jgi:hypothetical protein